MTPAAPSPKPRKAKRKKATKRKPKRPAARPMENVGPVEPTEKPPRAKPVETHVADWRAKAEAKALLEKARDAAVRKTEALSGPATKRPTTVEEWREILMSLPKFDPWALAGDCHFDGSRAWKAIEFIETHVRHRKGRLGGRFLRLSPWQVAFIANLFGWVRPPDEDGFVRRRFREALLYVAKKNGKSTLAEGIALYCFLEDDEPGAEVYCAAAKKEQARVVWDGCAWQIRRDPELRDRCHPYQYHVEKDDSGKLKPISADADTEDGMNPSCTIVDELHRQPDADLVGVVRFSMTRPSALLVFLTTSDEERESVCNDTLKQFKAVRDNPGDPLRDGYDDSLLPAIYEADEDDDWADPVTWRKANPNIGVTITEAQIAKEFQNAKENPAQQADFRRLRLNQRVKTTSRAFDMVAWDKCAGKITPEMLVGRTFFVGIDIGSTDDLVAQIAYSPKVDAVAGVSPMKPAIVLAWFWVPEAQAVSRKGGGENDGEDKRKSNVGKNSGLYRKWEVGGFLTLTDGDQIDDDEVRESMARNITGLKVVEWGFDRAGAARYTQRLQELGHKPVAVGQGWLTMNEPFKALVVEVGRGELLHGGHPVLRWCANNAERKIGEREEWSLAKPKGHLKVDGIAALLTAKARAMVAPTGPKKSIYETRGAIVV